MRPGEIVRSARAERVQLHLTERNTIRVCGPQDAVARWAPVIRQHKAAVLDRLERRPLSLGGRGFLRNARSHASTGSTVEGFAQRNLYRMRQGRCPWCGGEDWWSAPGGERVCLVCHPPPGP